MLCTIMSSVDLYVGYVEVQEAKLMCHHVFLAMTGTTEVLLNEALVGNA